MRNKIVMITAALAVMMAMTGIAAATTTIAPTNINIDISGLNPATVVTITHNPIVPTALADGINFTIYQGSIGSTLTNEVKGSWDGISYTGNTGESNTAPIIGSDYQWTFYIKDDHDSDDSTQVGTQYRIVFKVYNQTTGTILYTGTEIGSATTYGTAIPEFATVAIPIAAVLGLVFFFQQRKNKKK